MEHDLIEIARISGPKGLKGQMWIIPYGDSFERFRSYSHLRIGKTGERMKVLSCSRHKGRYLLSLEGVSGRGQVEDIAGGTLFIERSQLEEPGEGEYYWHDLLGMSVRDLDGRELGKVVRIFNAGSSDVYVVDEEKEHYIPATADVVREISLDAKSIVIDASLLEGLLD